MWLYLFLLLSTVSAEDHLGCPSSWDYFDSNCYYFERSRCRTFANARSDCVGRDSALTSIHSKPEDDFIQARISSQWIGLNDLENENVWKWVDGSPVTYLKWNAGEPNNAGNEDCVEISGHGWNDALCNRCLKYVCKKKAELCAVDYYGPSGRQNCTRCPTNSWTDKQAGSTRCVCKDSFYRAQWESVHEECSGLPSAPSILESKGMPTSAILSWTTPSNTGGRNDIYYLVSCSDNSSSVRFSPSSNLTGTSVSVFGLTPSTNYTFTITALNGVAHSTNTKFWRSVVATVYTQETIPGYPLIEVVNSTEETVLVRWELREEDETCKVCSYELCYHTAGESCDLQYAKYPATNMTVIDLQPGTKYYLKVRVKCCNERMNSSWTYTVAIKTLGVKPGHAESGLPSAPQSLVSTAMPTSVTLRWTTPNITGSRNDTYYLVSCSKSSSVRFTPSHNVTGTSVTVLGLTPKTNYTCIVTALNGVAGPNNKHFWRSTVAVVHTNEAVPKPPVIATVNSTNDTILVGWEMRKENETCEVCSYELCYHTDEDSCHIQTVQRLSSQLTVRDLQPGTEYYFKDRIKRRG